MKYVTRKINVYSYTYGKPDIKTGAIYDMHTIERGKRMTKQAAEKVGIELGGLVLLGTVEETRVYRMTVDEFIQAAEQVKPEDMTGDETEEDENDNAENGGQEEMGGND